MARTVLINGEEHSLPTSGDSDWGSNFNDWALAITSAVEDGAGIMVVNVKAAPYGALGNGVADDTAAIAAAIAAVEAAGGGRVFVPAGTYRLTSGLQIVGDNVALYGVGRASVLKWDAAFAGTCISASATAGNLRYSTQVADLCIWAQNATNVGLHLTRTYDSIVSNVLFRNSAASSSGKALYCDYGSGLDYATGLSVSRCSFFGWHTCIEGTTQRFTAVAVMDCFLVGRSDAGSVGIKKLAGGSVIANNRLIEGFDVGIDCGESLGDVTIHGNRFELNAVHDISIGNGTRNVAVGPNIYTASLGAATIDFAGDAEDYNVVWGSQRINSHFAGNHDQYSNTLHGPERALYNQNESVAAQVREKYFTSNATTNLFGESVSAREYNLASIATPMKLGATGAYEVKLFSNGAAPLTVNATNKVTITKLNLAPQAAPASGEVGDMYVSSVDQKLYICTAAGTPGTWVVVGSQ